MSNDSNQGCTGVSHGLPSLSCCCDVTHARVLERGCICTGSAGLLAWSGCWILSHNLPHANRFKSMHSALSGLLTSLSHSFTHPLPKLSQARPEHVCSSVQPIQDRCTSPQPLLAGVKQSVSCIGMFMVPCAEMLCLQVGRTGWHIDGSFMPKPFAYSTYHIVSCPSQAGIPHPSNNACQK